MKEKKELKNYIINKRIDLDKIVDDYTPYIRKIIQNMVGNNLTEEDKEEIILDTFFVLWKRHSENFKINSLDSYMAGIARNLVKEKLKKLKYNIDIEQCVTKIIKMFYYSNKSIKDIAKELKITEVNVKTRLHRIRKKIKQELRKGGF